MVLFRIFIGLGAIALTAAIFWALQADTRGLAAVLRAMASEPWTVVTLIDLYLGFFIVAALIFWIEKNPIAAIFWALPTFFLGNVWAAVWLIIRFPAIKGRLRDG